MNTIKLGLYLVLTSTLLATGLAMPAHATSARLAPYTDNPLVEFLARQRYHLIAGVQFDTATNDHDPMTLMGGLGLFPTDQLSVGLYASTRGSDRRYPYRMSNMYGLGVFSEYNFAPTARFQPFGGLRIGMLDATGPAGVTSLHMAGIGGLKWAISQNLAISASAVLNWAQDDILDYKENEDGTSISTSNTDIGVEVGLRFGF